MQEGQMQGDKVQLSSLCRRVRVDLRDHDQKDQTGTGHRGASDRNRRLPDSAASRLPTVNTAINPTSWARRGIRARPSVISGAPISTPIA